MSKKYLIIIVVAVILLVYAYVSRTGPSERILEDVFVENDNYSLSFNYVAGEDGYELIQSSTQDDFLQSYVMVGKNELLAYQENEADTAPPTMSIFIFHLPDEEVAEGEEVGRVTRLQNWAQSNSGITSYEQIYGTPKIVEIDGVKALEYSTDGIYQQSIFLASYRGYIYMFVGQYDRPTDSIKSDFVNLMQSVRFE